MKRSAASSSPTSTSACALRWCHGRNAGSSDAVAGLHLLERLERPQHVSGPVLGCGKPGRRDRLGGDVALERRRLRVDRAHVGVGHRPVADSAPARSSRTSAPGRSPSDPRTRRQARSPARPRPRRCPTRPPGTGRGSGPRATAPRRRAGRAPGSRVAERLERRARSRAGRPRPAAGNPSGREGRSRRRAAAPRDRPASDRARRGPGRACR